jgi:hypothetical protein
MPRYISCPVSTCGMAQPYHGQVVCDSCEKEMSNWHIATQLLHNVTEAHDAYKLKKSVPIAA